MIRAKFGRFTICTTLLMSAVSSATYAQVVQLPTWHSFGVSTTVSVPDRGGVLLGGSTLRRTSRATHGVPSRHLLRGDPRFRNDLRNGASVSRSNATATIIDLHEWDKTVLTEARRREGEAGAAADAGNRRQAEYLSRHVATSSHGRQLYGPSGPAGQDRPTSRVGLSAREERSSDSFASAGRRHAGEERNESNGGLSQLTYDQLMSRGRDAMSARQYRLAKEYFQAAAAE